MICHENDTESTATFQNITLPDNGISSCSKIAYSYAIPRVGFLKIDVKYFLLWSCSGVYNFSFEREILILGVVTPASDRTQYLFPRTETQRLMLRLSPFVLQLVLQVFLKCEICSMKISRKCVNSVNIFITFVA